MLRGASLPRTLRTRQNSDAHVGHLHGAFVLSTAMRLV